MATNTAASFTNHTGNASAGPFSISFNYLSENEIDVTVDGVLKTKTTHYTFPSATTISFTSGNHPASGAAIKFQRDTDISSLKVDFQNGSVLTESDLDNNSNQLLYGLQEYVDTAVTDINAAGAVVNSDLDGKGELLVGDGSGDPSALPVGTNGHFLKADSSTATGLAWAADNNTTYSVGDGGLTQNNFTNTLKTKLDGIAASANNYSISSDLLDEDNMASNSATKVPSQQSVKAYVDANAGIGDIVEHKNALSADKTIGTNNNALVAGPFSTGSYTLTIPSGSVFTVV